MHSDLENFAAILFILMKAQTRFSGMSGNTKTETNIYKPYIIVKFRKQGKYS